MISQDYLNLLKECGLANNPKQEARGIHFGFLITYKEDYPALKDYLLNDDRRIFPYEEFQVYQINLCKTNAETLKIELKIPLFGGDISGEFEQFLSLLSNYNITSKGHLNNQLDFSIFSGLSSDDKKALSEAKININSYNKSNPSFDLNRAVIVTANYYETTKYATKLASYLGGTGFIQDYKLYVE